MQRFVTSVHPQIASNRRVNFETLDDPLPEPGLAQSDHEPVDQIFGSAVQAKTPRGSLVKVGSSAIKRVAHLLQVTEVDLAQRHRRRPPNAAS